MLHPEHSSGSEHSYDRRVFLSTLGSAAVGAGLTMGAGLMSPAEDTEAVPAIKREINGARRNIVATIEHTGDSAGTVEYLCLDEGLTFGIVETDGFREFDMTQMVEKAKKEGEADTVTDRAEILKNMGKEKNMRIREENEDFLFCGSNGIMAITRGNILRVFQTLQGSKRFAQPLVVGGIDCRLQKEILSRRITVKTVQGIELHFAEKQAPADERIAMK